MINNNNRNEMPDNYWHYVNCSFNVKLNHQFNSIIIVSVSAFNN